jgi:predicted transcriptional regulator
MEEKERIELIVSGVDLEKKARVTKKEKEAFSELKSEIETIKNEINKLHLMLWHTGYKGDYHSLTLDDAMERLRQIKRSIDDILDSARN